MAQNGMPAEKYGVYWGRTHSEGGKSLLLPYANEANFGPLNKA